MEAAGKRYIIHAKRTDRIRIVVLADLHLGNVASETERLWSDILAIRDDPYCFWIGVGDYADYIGHHDPRFDPTVIDPTISICDLGHLGELLRDRVKTILAPIGHKCLGLCMGNHEKKLQQHTMNEGLHPGLCNSLDTVNLQYSGIFDLVFVRMPIKGGKPILLPVGAPPPVGHTHETFRMCAHHGAGSAQTEGGKINRLVAFMNDYISKVYLIAHLHDQIIKAKAEIGANEACDKLADFAKLGIMTGSYLRTAAQGKVNYPEMKMMKPTPLGSVNLSFFPEWREISATITVGTGRRNRAERKRDFVIPVLRELNRQDRRKG